MSSFNSDRIMWRGKYLEEMTREELVAALAQSIRAQKSEFDERQRQREVLRGVRDSWPDYSLVVPPR